MKISFVITGLLFIHCTWCMDSLYDLGDFAVSSLESIVNCCDSLQPSSPYDTNTIRQQTQKKLHNTKDYHEKVLILQEACDKTSSILDILHKNTPVSTHNPYKYQNICEDGCYLSTATTSLVGASLLYSLNESSSYSSMIQSSLLCLLGSHIIHARFFLKRDPLNGQSIISPSPKKIRYAQDDLYFYQCELAKLQSHIKSMQDSTGYYSRDSESFPRVRQRIRHCTT